MHDAEAMPERLAAFLTEQTGKHATIARYEQMTGGYSRLMAHATVAWEDGATDDLVVRGDPPAGQAMIETDRDTEWALLSALTDSGAIPTPAARWYDPTGDRLGTKAIVLDFCPGPSLQQVLDGGEGLTHHAAALATTMGRLHATERSIVGAVLDEPASWVAHIDSLIAAFGDIEGAALEAEPVLRYTAGYLDANRPPTAPLTIVHGDFQPANIMVGDDGAHLLVDWELCHIGDPREDLGYYLNYAAATGPNLYEPDPEGFLAHYREASGFDEDAVNPATVGYFSSLAAVKLWGQILAGATAMAQGANSGIMTTYTIPALTIGRQNFLTVCAE